MYQCTSSIAHKIHEDTSMSIKFADGWQPWFPDAAYWDFRAFLEMFLLLRVQEKGFLLTCF